VSFVIQIRLPRRATMARLQHADLVFMPCRRSTMLEAASFELLFTRGAREKRRVRAGFLAGPHALAR
jgi:hypothetical protein